MHHESVMIILEKKYLQRNTSTYVHCNALYLN